MCPLRYIILLLSMILGAVGIMQALQTDPEEEKKLSKPVEETPLKQTDVSSLEILQHSLVHLMTGQFIVHLFKPPTCIATQK